jgi:hypothetical protein
MKKFVTTILLAVGLLYGLSLAQEPKVIKFIPNGGGPQWSPDGKYVSYYLKGNLWLYDVAADSSWNAAKFYGGQYEWLNDSQVVFINVEKTRDSGVTHCKANLIFSTIGNNARGKESDSIRAFVPETGCSIALHSDKAGTVALIMSDTTVVITQNGIYRGSKQTRFFRAAVIGYPGGYPRGKPLPEDKGIWLLGGQDERLRRVTDNSEYFPPELSPNGLFVTAADMGGYKVIMDTSGLIVARIYHAEDEFWAATCDALYFTRTVQGGEDGGDIVGGDVFEYSLKTRTETQLTFTPDIAEFHPRVSPDGNMLAYVTYHKIPEDGTEILLLKGGQR